MSATRTILLAAAALTTLACGSKPTIGSFTATPAAIVDGDLTNLAWTVTDATSLSLSNGTAVADVTGTLQSSTTPSTTTTYTLTATNDHGSTTASATVTVSPRPIPASIQAFSASPLQAAAGAAVTLSWLAGGVVSQSIDQGVPALSATAKSVVVNPTATTTYTLTVQGTAGTKSATAQATVFVSGTPAITSFTATPATVAPGGAAVLAWVSDGSRFSVSDGSATGTSADLGPLLSLRVRPTVTTTYTLTALTGVASATKTVTVTVSGAAATGLVYTNPAATTEAVKLVKNAASTPGLLVLDLVVNQAASASAFALNLPLDGDTAGSRDGSARAQLDTSAATALPSGWVTVAPGFDVDPGKLNPGGSGTAPYAAVANVGAAGTLQGVLSAGIAQKPQGQCQASSATCVGAAGGEAALKAGDVLGHLRLVLKPGAGPGTVFDPATFAAAPSGYKALLRGAASTSSSFAIGKLVAQ